MSLPDFLTRGPMGELRVTGHRIDLYHIVGLQDQGYSAERIHHEYPTLALPLVEKVLAFCLSNQEEVDAYVNEVRDRIERQRTNHQTGPGIQRLRNLKEAGSPSPR